MIIMCIGDDPVARAMPYIISSIISLIVTILLFTLPIIKRWNSKYSLIAKIIMSLITIILLYLTYVHYFLMATDCI